MDQPDFVVVCSLNRPVSFLSEDFQLSIEHQTNKVLRAQSINYTKKMSKTLNVEADADIMCRSMTSGEGFRIVLAPEKVS